MLPKLNSEWVVIATTIANINGNTAKRVKKPLITNNEHPTSTKIIITNDTPTPHPIGSGKPSRRAVKFSNFAIPCVSIIPPANSRNSNNPKFAYRSDTINRSQRFSPVFIIFSCGIMQAVKARQFVLFICKKRAKN